MLQKNVDETKYIIVDSDGFIKLTKDFIDFGSTITFDLNVETEIKRRFTKTNKAMGALNFIWTSNKVNLYSKILLYRSMLLSLLLWGYKN